MNIIIISSGGHTPPDYTASSWAAHAWPAARVSKTTTTWTLQSDWSCKFHAVEQIWV